MPLPWCPWMTARCPHKEAACSDPESKKCFHIVNSVSSSAKLLASVALLKEHEIPEGLKEALTLAKEIIEKDDIQNGNW